jgi:hypothetical protein
VFSFKGWSVLVLFLVVLFVFCFLYFEKRLDTPNYSVGDAAIHYKLMSQTLKTGMMPLFLPNELYVASGFNQDFKFHNATYFPGTSVAFFVLSKVTNPNNPVSTLQILNVFFFELVSLYLVYIFWVRKKIKSKALFAFSIFIVATGTFFDFIFNSYTTQLFGLFLLLFFVDTFDRYLEGDISFFVPMVSLSAMIISYFYWLPIVFLYVFFSNTFEIKKMFKGVVLLDFVKDNKKLFGSIGVVFGALFLSMGYIITLYKQNLLGYAGAIGGIPRWKLFLPQASLMIPFAFIYIYFQGKRKVSFFERFFVFDFCFAVFSYAIVLWMLMLFHKVSGYTMLKSLYLVVPIIWILGVILVDELSQKIGIKKVISFKIIFKKICSIAKQYLIKKNRIEIVFLFLSLFLIIFYRSIRFIPLTIDNIKLIGEIKKNNLTSEQMELLDKIKKEAPMSLWDGRIATIAPFETALWVYSYSGIWPRTYSLLPEGVLNDTMGSPMSVASAGIINYLQWLKNDKDHYLLYLDNKSARDWVKWNSFNFNEYDVLSAVEENKLLKLKGGGVASWSIQTNDPSLKKRESLSFPYSQDFIPVAENLAGLAFKFDFNIKKMKSSDKYYFSLSEGVCNLEGKIVAKSDISIDNLKNLDKNDFYYISFDTSLAESKNKKYCIRWRKNEGADDSLRIMSAVNKGGLILNEIYKYQK